MSQSIRLLKDLPIEARHGALKGLEVEAEIIPEDERGRGCPLYRFVSPKSGEKIGVMFYEAEIIEEAK